MKLSLQDIKDLSSKFTRSLGFNDFETKLIVENTIEAELSGHLSHGLGNLLWFKTTIDTGGVNKSPISRNGKSIKVIKETPVSLMIDGQNHTGFVVMRQALDKALTKVKRSYIDSCHGDNQYSADDRFLGPLRSISHRAEFNLYVLEYITREGRSIRFNFKVMGD
ncbi:hypothetical protein A2160_03500 [Candidatus Beckwithbacteria bacterium RBG_13_42_9]|uniref:Uncharacterized protein n=1 Tax=Candidatus Beckwithbacteria bacterium RBG_13_42_9 TaxID=1797457 RepID=A0A1F5E8H6_9BACT|nr:MAG: hypothetical protein A2160_03500 [Candidatus Beckwithbacteria bacterium RBG_13_42_9]